MFNFIWELGLVDFTTRIDGRFVLSTCRSDDESTDDNQCFLFPNSFLLLVVRHLSLEAMHLFLVASCFY